MAKPSVDGLEAALSDEVTFTRVNIREQQAQSLAAKYRIRVVPTFLLLGPNGDVLYRKEGGRPDRRAIEAKLATLPSR